jgi:hypothetical protein
VCTDQRTLLRELDDILNEKVGVSVDDDSLDLIHSVVILCPDSHLWPRAAEPDVGSRWRAQGSLLHSCHLRTMC